MNYRSENLWLRQNSMRDPESFEDSQMTQFLENDSGRLDYRPLADGTYELEGRPTDMSVTVPHSPIRTAYPLSLIRLIFDAYGATHTCDEISRDIDPAEASLDVRYSYLAYFDNDTTTLPLKILDYGCGAGSSTVALARLFPRAERILGVDFVPELLEIARERARHHALHNVDFKRTHESGAGIHNGEQFDLVFLNAVYEHLLPDERVPVLASTWASLRTGGSLILNQTPHRWFPVESHTSGLPLLNYVPDPIAHWMIRTFSTRSIRTASWDQLLRAGVRGASVSEIRRNLLAIDGSAALRAPVSIARSWAGIWYAAKMKRLERVESGLSRKAIQFTAALVEQFRLPLSPYVNIAFTKVGVA